MAGKPWFFLEDEIREEESKSFILSSGPVEIENCIRGYSDEMLDEKLVIKDVDTVKARFSEVWWDLQLGFRAQLGTLSNSVFCCSSWFRMLDQHLQSASSLLYSMIPSVLSCNS